MIIVCLSFLTIRHAGADYIQCPPEPTDMIIAYEDLVKCSIDTTGDSDIFRFSGNIGDVIIVEGTWRSGSMRPCIELVAPDTAVPFMYHWYERGEVPPEAEAVNVFDWPTSIVIDAGEAVTVDAIFT
jgi:hypothetical protein